MATIDGVCCQYITWISLLLVLNHLIASRDLQGPECPTLYLLNVEPYPVTEDSAGKWDRAFELIPAGHLAAEQINNRSDLLPEHKLMLIDIDSEACGKQFDVISKGITNVYRVLVNPNLTCIVGVIGLFCSPMTNAISPIISHPNIGGYVHIAASTSPLHHDSGLNFEGSNLFHIVGSASILNKAVLALMHTYNWRRIASINTESHYYYTRSSNDFIERVLSNPEFELTTHINTSPTESTETFNIINSEGARVSYWSVTDEMAAYYLCEAFWMNFTWPGYVYIIQEINNIDELFQAETRCSREELLKAMDNVFFIDYRLYVEDGIQLVSGVSYSEFQHLYTDKLREFASMTNENLQNNLYANSLYDQVWAFALAINNSLKSVQSLNLSFEDYTIGKRVPNLSHILEHELKNIAFQGASGWIDFNENHESLTFVNIFQFQKDNLTLVGIYDPHTYHVTLTEAAPHVSEVPPDTFETIYQLLPIWLGACILALQGIVFGLITANFLLILKWKSEKDIKAISPLLSLLMMIGCYTLCVTPVFQIAHRMFVLSSTTLVCYLKTWTWTGTDLILAVLFLKLLRVYHIFRTFRKTSRCWSDQYLFFYTLAICVGKVVLVILWNSTDSVYLDIHKEYVNRPDQLPYYAATVTCHTSGLWLVVTELYSGVLLFLVVILAVATRHIKKDNFKDTKKVNTFIFLVVIIIITDTALHILYHEDDIQIGADVAEWLPSFAIPMLCQVCLFIPKVLPLAWKERKCSGLAK